MQLTIDRLPVTDISRFFAECYEREKPVLLTGVELTDTERCRDYARLLANHADAQRVSGHVALPLELTGMPYPAIPLVDSVMSRNGIALKPSPVKVWMQPRGHTTLLHYDGNSLSGLNLQLHGRKRWLLVSPHTPPPLKPLSYLSLTNETFTPHKDRHDYYTFETEPGDLLYLPRYWAHRVRALESDSANLNWVWTSLQPNLQSRVGRRECALLKLKTMIPPLSRMAHPRISPLHYGDGGPTLLRNYTDAVDPLMLLETAIREVISATRIPFYQRSVARQHRQLVANNFRREDQPAETS